MAKVNYSKYGILGLLTIEPMTGYQIKKMSENSLSHFWKSSFGSIYPTLKQLISNSMVEKKELSSTKKNCYCITKKGMKYFQDWLNSPLEEDYMKSPLLLRIFFSYQVETKKNISQLEQYLEKVNMKIRILDGILYELSLKHKNSPHFPYWKMTLRRGQIIGNARKEWALECIDVLRIMEVDNDKESNK